MALRLAVLISGRGSNLKAIADAVAQGDCDAHVAVVVSDRAEASGLAYARSQGMHCRVVRMDDYADRSAWDCSLTEAVLEVQPDLVVLAGFMRLVGPNFLGHFAGRAINVHPALLPLFPGTRGPAQALAAGMRVSGCTVHVVDSGVDTGPILAQAVVPIEPDDDADTLHARIQKVEHLLLPRVIQAISRGQITLLPEVRVNAAPDPEAQLLSLASLASLASLPPIDQVS
jgi:phosphoribosylglycinamide formyltransferase-1